MKIDDRRLGELINESQDLQSDALRGVRESLPDLREIGAERRASKQERDPEPVARYNASRRGLLRHLGLGGGALAGRAALGGGFGAALAAIISRPAAADEALDVQILQTASSLEILAVATYEAALGLGFIQNGNPTIKAFAETTMSQHAEHNQAFQAQTEALGAQPQTKPNPKFVPVVEKAKPTLKAPLDVVKLAEQLERVATDTYLVDLTLFEDERSKEVMGSVMGVESQHLATLRAVGALLAGGAPELVAIPTEVAKLPAAAGSVAFPASREQTPEEFVADPESGAVK